MNIQKLDWPLMHNNITRADLDCLIDFLRGEPILTQSAQVREFEREWSDWLGVKHSVFVNSGASANLITISALKHLYGGGEIIVPPLTWVSDIASVIQNGFTPVFVDINPANLAMDDAQILERITEKTRAVFLTHVQGFNGLTRRLLDTLSEKKIPLIEDVCESHGAAFEGRRLGSFGFASNFSYYYAHHMSTIEGGMVCTNDSDFYEVIRMFRSHGMVRESTSAAVKERYTKDHPDLNPDFIFAYPAYNVRNTEIGAVLGRNQLKRLDANNVRRNENFKMFLDGLDKKKYFTEFDLAGSSNYAFNLVLREPDDALCAKVMSALREANVEFRRGSAGGGNQIRQPYLKDYVAGIDLKKFPRVDHIHFYGFYIGNYPDLPREKIQLLCDLLNSAG